MMDPAERKFWGRTPPEKRGVWGRYLRIKRGARTQDDVRQTLASLGRPISGAYYSDLENGRADVNEDWQQVFVRMYDEGPSETEPVVPVDEPVDMASLLVAQNDLLRQQVSVLTRIAATLEVLVGPEPVETGETVPDQVAREVRLALLRLAASPATDDDPPETSEASEGSHPRGARR